MDSRMKIDKYLQKSNLREITADRYQEGSDVFGEYGALNTSVWIN